jgi:hypothetical protein
MIALACVGHRWRARCYRPAVHRRRILGHGRGDHQLSRAEMARDRRVKPIQKLLHCTPAWSQGSARASSSTGARIVS